MKVDVLAIRAHPDDVELSVRVSLILLAREGKKIGMLDLTRESWLRGTPEIRIKRSRGFC